LLLSIVNLMSVASTPQCYCMACIYLGYYKTRSFISWIACETRHRAFISATTGHGRSFISWIACETRHRAFVDVVTFTGNCIRLWGQAQIHQSCI